MAWLTRGILCVRLNSPPMRQIDVQLLGPKTAARCGDQCKLKLRVTNSRGRGIDPHSLSHCLAAGYIERTADTSALSSKLCLHSH